MSTQKRVFKGQKDDEEVVEVFRKHWFSFIRPILVFVVLLSISLIILWYWSMVPLLLLIVGFVVLLVAVSYLGHCFLLWWNDIYILTNRRVINFDQKSLFHRVVSEADLRNIQDSTYEVEGVWQTFLNYGQVKILTASMGESIVFEDVPDPHRIQGIILRAKDAVR
ncbi:PH domain-containing protein [Patescibacteria group bacterium]|nr:PH domain-containing protein [Patescibacteria group bacterium]